MFVLLLTLSYIPSLKSADAVSFSDVSSGYWAASEIADLVGKGILNGYPDGTFKPDNSVTRAEFAKIISLAMGYSPNPSASLKFPDVAQDHWAFGYIASAVDHGLVKGYPDGTFGPSRNVTKAEVLTIIARAQNWSGGSGSHFNDVPSGYWAFASIEACFANGIIKNSDPNIVSSSNLGPDEPATRGQTCVFTDQMIIAQGQAVSTTKGKIAFTSGRDGNLEIYLMNVDGSEQVRLTNKLAYDAYPSFSPDGSKIAFESYRDDNYEIYIMNADGSEQVNLTNNRADEESPSFSPDGSKIAFCSNHDGTSEIYLMNSDGSEQVRLTNNQAYDGRPSLSPDGSKIAFSSDRDGNWEIYIMNVDGSAQVNLSNNQLDEAYPSFSPDGSKIAFTSKRDGNSEIYIMNVDGSAQVRLTNNQADDWASSFSRDGARIAFSSDRDGTLGQIYIMNVDGSEQVNLSNNQAEDWAPSFSPDGPTTPVPTTPAPTTPAPTTPAPPPGVVEQFFKVWSTAVAYNSATAPTKFTISDAWQVTEILTYHWNNGQGMPAGTIGLQASDGTMYGPWQATATDGSGATNVAWVVKPNIILPPGAYTVIDSDPASWSQNGETGGAGMAWGYGIRQNNP